MCELGHRSFHQPVLHCPQPARFAAITFSDPAAEPFENLPHFVN